MDIKNETDEELVNYSLGGNDYSNAAQIEMMRRLKNTIQDLDKNTVRYSRRLIDLTILLFFVALIQVLISLMAVSVTWNEWILLSIIVLYGVYYLARRIDEIKK
jgi:uncharacterized membrane protein